MYNITLSKEQLEELQWVFYREQSKTAKKLFSEITGQLGVVSMDELA